MGDTTQGNVPEKTLPRHLVQELTEHTVGGFALFYFHPVTGYPQHVLAFDSPAHCLAMQKYMLDWSAALQDIYVEGVREQILEKFHTPEEPEES
jgi:hypothetical protein